MPASPGTWRMAFSGLVALLVGIGFGRFGFTPLVPGLVQAGWFSAGAAGYLGACNLLGFMLGAQLSGRATRHWGIPAVLRLAMLAALASFAAEALNWGFTWHLAARSIAGVAGGFIMALTVPAVLAATPPARRGMVGGIIFAAMGLGMVISGTVVPWLLQISLPAAWLGFVAIGAPLVLLAWNGLPRTLPDRAGEPATIPSAGTSWPVALIAAGICAGAMAFAPHTIYWADFIARALGHGVVYAGLHWMLLGLAAGIIPALLGLLADRIGFTRALRLTLAGLTLAVALPAVAHGPLALALSSILAGGCGVGIAALGSGRTLRIVGPARHRAVWGSMVIFFGLSQAASSWLMAFLLARTGSYTILFAAGGTFAAAGVTLDWSAALLERRGSDLGTAAGRA